MKIIITDENIELIDASVEEAAVSISVLVNTIRGIMHSKENEVMIDNILKKIFIAAVDAGFNMEEIEP